MKYTKNRKIKANKKHFYFRADNKLRFTLQKMEVFTKINL